MTRKLNQVTILIVMPWAVWLNVSEPMIGRPYGQPALVSDQAASRLAPTGFDQAQKQ